MNAAEIEPGSVIQVEKPNSIYLVLGSNIDPVHNLRQAIRLLRDQLVIEKCSMAWQSPAIGGPWPDYLNAAVHGYTQLQAGELKQSVIHPLESSLGRVRLADKYAPRTIDIDLVVFNETVHDPHLWELAYMAVPLAELFPDLTHPATGEPLVVVAARLTQTTTISPRPEVLESINHL